MKSFKIDFLKRVHWNDYYIGPNIYVCVCDTSNELSFDNEAFSDS